MEEKASYSAEENTSFFARISKKKLLAGIVTFVAIFSALVVGGKFLSSRIGRQPEILIGEPSPTPSPAVTSIPASLECSFWCEEILAYTSDWEKIPSDQLTNGELEVPQTVYFLVKGETDCSEDITQARLRFEDESTDAWRYSSDAPPSGIAGDCEDGTYTCFYWEEEFTEAKCYDAESEVCIGDSCQ